MNPALLNTMMMALADGRVAAGSTRKQAKQTAGRQVSAALCGLYCADLLDRGEPDIVWLDTGDVDDNRKKNALSGTLSTIITDGAVISLETFVSSAQKSYTALVCVLVSSC